jgi:biopolymer transport protein ExbB/TolQ
MNNTDATIVSVLLKMGLTGQLIILLIFLLSMISLFIFIERLVTLKRSTVPSQQFIQKIKEAIYSNNPSAATGKIASSIAYQKWRLLKDALARHFVVVGGLSIIVAIVLIFFYLLCSFFYLRFCF